MFASNAVWLVLGWIILTVGSMTGCGQNDEPASGDIPAAATENSASDSLGQRKGIQPDASQLIQPDLVAAAASLDEVDSRACQECHSDRFDSYQQTAHSRSLRLPDLASAHAGQLFHGPSNRSLTVKLESDRIVHSQTAHFPNPDQSINSSEPRLPIGELPVEYVMGSGTFAEAYLLRDRDYLVQAPLAWYTGTNQYDMSPGYEGTQHKGMTRVIQAECMLCHVGSLTDRTEHRPVVGELAIGCQRCHGSGAAHVARYEKVAKTPDTVTREIEQLAEIDQIVNPAKLDRRERESVCAQCHLQGEYIVNQNNRLGWDFQPGENYADTRLVYEVDAPDKPAGTFVGHFSQLWQSKCYIESDSLTCITCHDPHHNEPIGDLRSHHREQCMQCHTNDTCGVDLDHRVRQNQNSCTDCHMPKVGSEVPHVATTDHRIRIRAQSPVANAPPTSDGRKRVHRISPPGTNDLTPVADLIATSLLLIDQMEMFDGVDRSNQIASITEQLEQAITAQPAQSTLRASAAILAHHKISQANFPPDQTAETWQRARTHADAALKIGNISTPDRLVAVGVIADHEFAVGNFPAAAAGYRRLTRSRRKALDYYNLGISLAKLRDFRGAHDAFQESLRIDGSLFLSYRSLSILYRTIDPSLADQMADLAARFERQANAR